MIGLDVVTITTSGSYCSSEPSLSSASATKTSPVPGARWCPPSFSSPRPRRRIESQCCKATTSTRWSTSSRAYPTRGACVALHEGREHRRPEDHRDPPSRRLHEFGIVLRDRGVRGDHSGRPARQQVECARVVADPHHGAAGAQRTAPRGSPSRRNRNLTAASEQDPRDAGHARTADPDHVHPLEPTGRLTHRFPLATSTTICATAAAALR